MSRLLFWSGAGLLGYTLVGFPLLVLLRGLLARRDPATAPITPLVSLIVSAHNEEDAIGAKLDSLVALDYPADRLEIIVASDGSDDRTNEIVAGYADRGVRLLGLPRVGKATALNAAVEASRHEILVFSDANSLFAPDALRRLVAPFADATVGGVAGDQRYLPAGENVPAGDTIGERRYWDFDRLLKEHESRAGHVISATGAIYAVRRSLFEPVPDAVTDDFVISTGVIERGHRLVFAGDAVAYEPVAESSAVEFGRKVRIMTRGFRAVVTRRALLDPRRHGFYAVQLVSHKVLRRLMAVPLLAIALGTLGLVRRGAIYRLAALGQAAFYGAAAVGLLSRRRGVGGHPLFALPAFFCMVNWAGVVAFANLVRGRRIERWEPARPTAGPDDGRAAGRGRRPPTVAVIGPDGAGKTTITRRLPAALGRPTAYLYMGINLEASNVMLPTTRLVLALKRRRGGYVSLPREAADAPRRPGLLGSARSMLRLTNQVAEEWFRQLVAWTHQRKGRIVIFDRHFFLDYHAYDVATRRRRDQPLARRLHGLMLERLYPRPDLVLYLDGPAETLHRRKGEGTIASIERRRGEYLALRAHVPRFEVIDATRPVDDVLVDMADRILAVTDGADDGARATR